MLENTESIHLLTRYGYVAIFAGTMLEGETIVLIGGFLAHQGYLSLPLIIGCALVGSCLSDQGLFFLSRFKGASFLSRFPSLAAKSDKMLNSMRSRPVALRVYALFFRFLYGLRIISPVFLGMSTIPTLEFVFLNTLGAVLWAICFGVLGYIFSGAIETVIGKLAHAEMLIVVALIAVVGILFALHRRRVTVKEN